MSRKSKADKRKDKLKERKRKEDSSIQTLAKQLSWALEELCAPVLPEYIDDSNGLDLTGRSIVWRMGMIAWNIAVTGRKEIGDALIQQMKLGPEERQIVKNEIDGLVRRKYELFLAMRTAITSLAVECSGTEAKPKVKLGGISPEMPIPDFDSPAQPEQNTTHQKEAPMKHSFYDVKARQKVTAEVTEFVSYGEGKTQRFAFKAKTKDGRNLTAFVSREDWFKAKKK